MFSEYASRFLAQSQSRISSFRHPQGEEDQRNNPSDRIRRLGGDRGGGGGGLGGPSRFPTSSRSYLQRPMLGGGGNPYQPAGAASQFGQFPFASRTSAAAQAPLFYSATDEFREEDDEEERAREVADFYALQRSRRQFGASQLSESSEVDESESRGSGMDESGDGREGEERGAFGKGRGIRSSWRGGKSSIAVKGRGKGVEALEEEDGDAEGMDERSSEGGSKGKGRMVDIGLESTLRESLEALERDDSAPPDDIAVDRSMDDDPPAFQQFRRPPEASPRFPTETTSFLPRETDREAAAARPRPPSSDASSIPPSVSSGAMLPPRHDAFWSSIFLIALASLFSTYFLVWLHTSPPTKDLGDTIYTALQSSLHLLAIDTLVAIVVSLIWLALLRSYARPLVYLILIAVPVILMSFSLYPFISSFKGSNLQDKVMRGLSFIPGILAVLWTYTVYKGRHSLGKAIGILEFACRILAANPALLALGFAALAGVVLWTWIWISMFTRVFLGGHLSSTVKNLFIIDLGTWWLGSFFILMYLWTLAVGAGIQRSTTAATVSQWYFHRLAIPAPTSAQVVQAALTHSTSTLFGTICLSTLLALLVRLPLLLLPARIGNLINLATYSLIPTPIAALTNPLTMTYAAIHSQPLAASARGIAQMTFLAPTLPTTTLATPRFSASARTNQAGAPLLPYRLAKLLLHATRAIMTFALGFGAWVSTARLADVQTKIPGGGSLYGYIVGLIAGAIGWAVLGAMEGVLGGIVDAGIVCWGSESREGGGGGYCLEAGWLFGGVRV